MGQVDLASAVAEVRAGVDVLPDSLVSRGYDSDEEAFGKLSLVAPSLWGLPEHEKLALVKEYRWLHEGIKDLQEHRERLSGQVNSVVVELAQLRYVVCELGRLMKQDGAMTERLQLPHELAFALFRVAKPLITKRSGRELKGSTHPEDLGDHSPFMLANRERLAPAFNTGERCLTDMGFRVTASDLEVETVGAETSPVQTTQGEQRFVSKAAHIVYIFIFECTPLPRSELALQFDETGPKMNKPLLESNIRQSMPESAQFKCKVRVEL